MERIAARSMEFMQTQENPSIAARFLKVLDHLGLVWVNPASMERTWAAASCKTCRSKKPKPNSQNTHESKHEALTKHPL
jgi:hypothetical protein